MNLTIREDTRPYIDEFFRAMPEEMQKLPTFREVLEEVERKSREQGLAHGQVKGRLATLRETIARTLHLRFQADQVAWLSRLAELPLATLEALSEAAILADSVADFESRLSEITPANA